MKRTWTIWTGAAAVVFAFGAVACTGSESSPHPPQAQTVHGQATARAVLEIRGMACSSCAATVRAMLVRTPGVARVDVSAERAEGIIEFDAARVKPADLLGVVERLGYQARLEESTDLPDRSGT